MSDTQKVLIRKIDRQDKKLNNQFLESFLDDIVDNAGKVAVLHDYYYDDYEEEHNYRIRSEDNITLSRHEWRCGHDQELFDIMFMIITIEPPKLDEDLFTI